MHDTTLGEGTWLNEPSVWAEQAGVLEVTTDGATDFWRETHYGFTRDNGHFLTIRTDGDFTAQKSSASERFRAAAFV